jgi:hypothetical protein
MATAVSKQGRQQVPRATADGARVGVRGPVVFHIPADATTLDGFRAWVKSADFPDDVRATFISGEIDLDMSLEELETHVKVKQEVISALLRVSNAEDLGEVYGDGTLLSNEEGQVSNMPEGVFIGHDTYTGGKVILVPRKNEHGQFIEVVGTPDWVLEVISGSSVGKDTKRLREAYHKAGIAEYWLIDARGSEVVFQILYWRKKGYVVAPVKAGWTASRVFARSFRLVRRKNRRDLWVYQLEMRAD